MTNEEQTKPRDRVLLVDDNLTNLRVLYQALEAEGFELLVAQSGEEALRIAEDAPPQLILLDINMPGLDGYETCRRLKESEATKDAIVIFLSARREVTDKIKGLDLGAVDYVEKPFQFEEVVARVKKHLGIFHRQQELESRNKELEEQVEGGFQALSEADLKRMTTGGESARLEFKSTLRVNLHTQKTDKHIENACLKTVAAYLNSRGGILLVGVDDQGCPLGLDQDRFPSEDKMLLHWNSLLKAHLGPEFSPFIRSEPNDVDGKRLLVIECLPAPEPVFFRRENTEAFYIRTGNGTQELKPSEILAYLGRRK